MGIDIRSIKNATLQALAWKTDKGTVGILSDEDKDLSIFKNKAQKMVKQGKVSNDDFNQAMGLYVTKPDTTKVDKTEPQNATPQDATPQEKATESKDGSFQIDPNYQFTDDETRVINQAIKDSGVDRTDAGVREYQAFGKKLADACFTDKTISKNAYIKLQGAKGDELTKAIDEVILGAKKMDLAQKSQEYNAALKVVASDWQENDKQKVKENELKKAAIKKAEELNGGKRDSGIRKAARQNYQKIVTADTAREMTVDFHRIQTREQIEAVLKDNNANERITLDELVEKGAIKYNKATGNYDLSPLVDKIIEGVGYDFQNSRTHRDIKPETGEFEQTRRLVGGTFGYTDANGGPLTNHELKKLLKVAGVPTESKDWAKVLLCTVGGAALGGVTSLWTEPGLEITSTNTNTAVVRINGSDFIQSVDVNDITVVKNWTHYVPKGAIVGAVTGFLAGLADDPEIPVASISGDTHQELCNYLDAAGTNAPVRKYKEAIKLIALLYTNEDGTLQPEFKTMFKDRIGGENGVINKKELIKFLADYKAPEVQQPPVCDADTPCEITYEDVYKDNCVTEFVVKKGDTWSTIIHTYYEDVLKEHGWKATLNALREATGAKATDTDLPMLTKTVDGKTVKYMNLPCELLGMNINGQNLEENRTKYVATEWATEVKRSEGKELQAPEHIGYNAKDECTQETAFGKTQEEAEANLRKQQAENKNS